MWCLFSCEELASPLLKELFAAALPGVDNVGHSTADIVVSLSPILFLSLLALQKTVNTLAFLRQFAYDCLFFLVP